MCCNCKIILLPHKTTAIFGNRADGQFNFEELGTSFSNEKMNYTLGMEVLPQAYVFEIGIVGEAV